MPRLLVGIILLTTAATAPAQEKVAKLRWFGQSFFQLETSLGKKVVFDPHAIPEFGRNVLAADVVVCSHLHNDHTTLAAIQDPKAARIFYGLEETKKGRPPEWKKIDEKVGQVRVRTVGTYHDANEGLERGKNAVFVVEADGLVFCHLGDLGHELTQSQIDDLRSVCVTAEDYANPIEPSSVGGAKIARVIVGWVRGADTAAPATRILVA